jgi:hypothetical protein
MNFKKLTLAISLFTTLSAVSLSSFGSSLDCGQMTPEGIFDGFIIDVINMDTWGNTSFTFKRNNMPATCIQVDKNEPVKYKILMNSFLLRSKVTLWIGDHHEVKGIGYRNDE